MKIKELVSYLTTNEGKLKEVNRAQMLEIVGLLSDLLFDEIAKEDKSETAYYLYHNGKRRAKKKK